MPLVCSVSLESSGTGDQFVGDGSFVVIVTGSLVVLVVGLSLIGVCVGGRVSKLSPNPVKVMQWTEKRQE